MQTDIATIDKLHAIENLLREGYRSDLVGRTPDKLTTIELTGLKRELKEIDSKILKFEELYNLKSGEFADRFYTGQTDDSADSIDWISFLDMRQELLKKIALMQGKKIDGSK